MPSLIHSYSRYASAVSSYLVLVLGTKEAKVIGLVPILEADCHLVSLISVSSAIFHGKGKKSHLSFHRSVFFKRARK